jgi:hypothetical protein
MKLIVPSSLEEISLSKYQRYLKEFEYSKSQKNQETYLGLKMIEIFCEVTEEQARIGLVKLDTQWFRYYTDQMEQRKDHDWINVCVRLKRMYEAAEINQKKWDDKETTKAYLEVYV